MQRARMFGVLVCLSGLVSGCGVGQVDGGSVGTGFDRDIPADDGRNRGDTDGAVGAVNTDCVPAEVTALVNTYCASCHGDNPFGGKISLTAEGAFSKILPDGMNKTVAEWALLRMKNQTMPPGPKKPSASEIATFEAWVTGALVADCGGPDAGEVDAGDGSTVDAGVTPPDPDAGMGPVVDPNPFDTDPVGICTSGAKSSARRGTTMKPGEACVACHSSNPRLPKFTIAGTLYPTGHEVKECVGYGAMDTFIRVTDASGKIIEDLTPNQVGTFISGTPMPAGFRVKVISPIGERAMLSSPPHGDCNSCHTPDGDNGAPGRIRLP